MKRITTIDELRRARAELNGTVAFVPTMGFLHAGHLTLMRRGLELCDHLVVSVFVNPTQFGPGEDLDNYPRDLKGDVEKCRSVGCEIFFCPRRDHVYTDHHSTTVIVDELDRSLCGPSRPGHFEGVATIVAKLFNIVTPDVAVFGQKDYQQLAIIRRMTRDLNFDIRIEGVPIIREDDGLAMSSRNRYLDDDQRRQALCLSRGLVAAHRAYTDDPSRTVRALLETARRPIEAAPGAHIDYLECVHPQTLMPLDADRPVSDDGALMATAVSIGPARLIDNLRLHEPLPDGPLRSLP